MKKKFQNQLSQSAAKNGIYIHEFMTTLYFTFYDWLIDEIIGW